VSSEGRECGEGEVVAAILTEIVVTLPLVGPVVFAPFGLVFAVGLGVALGALQVTLDWRSDRLAP
jgi:hypothetical protein